MVWKTAVSGVVFLLLACGSDSRLERIDRQIQDGHYAVAEADARAVLLELDPGGDGNSVEVARTLDRIVLAMYRGGKGHLPEALDLANRAVAIKEAQFGPDDPELCPSLDQLGALLTHRGDYEAAYRLHERALAIRERVYGPDSFEASLTLNYLAPLLYTMGDYAAAGPLYERARDARVRFLGRDHPRVAGVLINMGLLADDMGDDESARRDYEDALRIYEAIDPNHPNVGYVLNNLAYVFWREGDYDEAHRLASRALEIFKRGLPADDPGPGDVLDLLGTIEHSRGHLDEARKYYEQALAVLTPALGQDHPTVALSLYGLAGTLLDLGEIERSRALFEKAKNIWVAKLGETHPFTAASRRGLAGALLDLGEQKASMREALEAEASSREHLRLTSRAFAEGSNLRYASIRVSGLDLALSLVANDPGAQDLDAVADAVIRSRALVLDEMAARRRALEASTDPEIAHLEARLVTARSRLANLMVRGVADDPATYAEQLERARQTLRTAEQDLARSSAPFRQELGRRGVGLAAVMGSLPDHGAMVAITRYHRYRPGGGPPAAAYLALTLKAEGDVAVPLGDADEIERLVEAWRAHVVNPWSETDGDGSSAEESYRRAAVALRKSIWDPIARSIGKARLVFVVPDGALHTVSFATLPVDGGRFLVESGPMIHYLSAERDLVLLQQEHLAGRGMLAIGSPDFDAHSSTIAAGASVRPGTGCGDLDSVIFSPLPGTEQEVNDLHGIWSRYTDQAFRLATGSAAQETVFKREAPGRRIVHLATHGFFLDGHCAAARAGTRGVTGLAGAEDVTPPTSQGENPLVLAGLALAGANHRKEVGADEEDGIVTAEEITSLDLQGVQWVVLSACDTGLGRIQEGEGVLGLRRAFQLAGARTLIMSLWSVDDVATRQWMLELYRARLEGGSTVEAVRQASIANISRRRLNSESLHPFYWGAFVAIGDWS